MSVFTNARLVLPGEEALGHLAVVEGRIEALGTGGSNTPGEDFGGDVLIPGLVELHTDHLEVHVAPRPQVRWNLAAAIQAHDAQMATSGITTVFDALRVGIDAEGGTDSVTSRAIADAIHHALSQGRLRADHRFHLRCEVSSESVVRGFELFDDLPNVDLVSLMDHTPGQRQFASLEAYRRYFVADGMGEAEFEAMHSARRAQAQRWSDHNRGILSARARERSMVLASHDDATLEHVGEAVRDGVTVAEFPTTVPAAEASRAAGMQVLMGAPNLVRGASHSGNVSAGELADLGALDILSSDYVPFSLIQGAFTLADRDGWTLPRAIATVTSAPARAVGLTDRGELREGMRADFVRVRRDAPGDIPVVRGVWREGQRVA